MAAIPGFPGLTAPANRVLWMYFWAGFSGSDDLPEECREADGWETCCDEGPAGAAYSLDGVIALGGGGVVNLWTHGRNIAQPRLIGLDVAGQGGETVVNGPGNHPADSVNDFVPAMLSRANTLRLSNKLFLDYCGAPSLGTSRRGAVLDQWTALARAAGFHGIFYDAMPVVDPNFNGRVPGYASLRRELARHPAGNFLVGGEPNATLHPRLFLWHDGRLAGWNGSPAADWRHRSVGGGYFNVLGPACMPVQFVAFQGSVSAADRVSAAVAVLEETAALGVADRVYVVLEPGGLSGGQIDEVLEAGEV